MDKVLKLQAKRKPMSFQNPQLNHKLLRTPDPVLGCHESMMNSEEADSPAYWDKVLETCQPVKDFMELKRFINEVISEPVAAHDNVPEVSKCAEEENAILNYPLNQYIVPSGLVQRWGSAMGILAFLISLMQANLFCFFKLLY